jgi:DtxR family transcriptional regulator, Mn-dependent transcriptional regulator
MAEDVTLLTESTQSYLVSILRLSQGDEPVPLSRLAESLNISPISVNQMCRKLQDQGLVEYTPYKGVSCTPEGWQLAVRILRRHRLWEVFLVDHLEMTWEEAHDAACLLEHSTPDTVVNRLDRYLGHPRVNPRGDPIPGSGGTFEPPVLRSLAEAEVGQQAYYVRCQADEATCAFLASQGLRAGAPLRVLAIAPEGVLIEVGGRPLALQRTVAAAVRVGTEGAWIGSQDAAEPPPAGPQPVRLSLSDLDVGQRAIVVRVDGDPRLRARLLEMGVVPGEMVTVRHLAPLGSPIELEIKGYHLSLRRQEARDILVEMEAVHDR